MICGEPPDTNKEAALVRIARSVADLRSAVPALMELAALDAKVKRHKFKALLAEGFTEAQALDLVKGPTQ